MDIYFILGSILIITLIKLIWKERQKMNKQQYIKYAIATDKYNLLQDDQNIIIYTIKKLYYKLILTIKNRRLIKWSDMYFLYYCFLVSLYYIKNLNYK
jgi:Mg2+/citrate symporter